jgi:uncharacterized protein YukE
MATYNFSPNAALDTGGELQFVTQQLSDSLDELWAWVQKFLSANEGASPDEFYAAHTNWSNGQIEMNQALVQGIVALEKIHHDYVLADNRGAQVFGSTL